MSDRGDTCRDHSPGTPAFLRTFADPGGDSAPMPFWMWNGDLDEDEIRRQIGLMSTAGVEAFVIHPREGLETEYLSDQWFEMTRVAVEEARVRGMKVWLYDELNWPSGYAGGKLIEEDPTRCARHLARVTMDAGGRTSIRHSLSPLEQLVAVFAHDGEGGAEEILPELVTPPGIEQSTTNPTQPHPNDDIDNKIDDYPHQPLPSIPKTTSTPIRLPISPDTTTIDLYISRPTSFSVTYLPGIRYTDLLDPEAVRLFISLTHDRYLKYLHDYFGTVVLGFFTDEPGFYNNLHGCDPGTIPWTAGFPAHFHQLKGYDLLPGLGSLWQPPGQDGDPDADAARVRADFFDTLADRYRASYFDQLQQWCRANGLQLIGHLLGEEDLLTTARSQGDFFRHFRHMDQAGVDLVGQVSEEQSVSVRLGASAALHLGLEQLQSETFGIFGWGLSLEHMRYTTDWQAVRGLTRLIPHAFHYSMAGDRHRECPPSLFFQNCWWPFYPGFQSYGRRLFAALEQGRPAASVALFYPLPTVWADLSAGPEGEAAARQVDAAFRGLALVLERAQIDFQILDAEMIGRAKVEQHGVLALDQSCYTVLILPECRALPAGMAEKLERFTAAGGLLAAVGTTPEIELADAGGETDPLREWSARIFPGVFQQNGQNTGDLTLVSVFGNGATIFVPHQGKETVHPAQGPRVLRLLRGLRKLGAKVVPRLEARATATYKSWLSRKRDRSAEAVAESSPFSDLVPAVAAHCAPALRILPADPEIRHLRKEIAEDDGGSLVFILNQGESEKSFTAAVAGPGRPWRLDPADGSVTPLHGFSIDPAERILLPMTLPARSSALLFIDRPEPVTTRVEETNLDEVLVIRRSTEQSPTVEGIAWNSGKKWARVVESGTVGQDSYEIVAKRSRQDWLLSAQVGDLPKTINFTHGWEIRFLPMEGGQFEDGLGDKWPQEMTLSNQPLQDWRALGRGQFSGSAEYNITFELDEHHVEFNPNNGGNPPDDNHPSGESSSDLTANDHLQGNNIAFLDLGDIREAARVIINGQPAGDLLWPPRRLRVEQFLRPGENRLTLVVTNTMANRLEPAPLPSGLLGPVRLVFGQTFELEFSPNKES